MRYFILATGLLFLGIHPLISQNALLDGINNNKTERADADDYYSEFKGTETSTCSFELSMRKYIDYILDYSIQYQTYTWNWKDITALYLGENKLELNSASSLINLSSKDKATEKITVSVVKSVFIYFTEQEQTKSAATWIVNKVKACGGSVYYKP